MMRAALVILLLSGVGCSYSIGDRSTVSDTTLPGRYELVDTSSNRRLAVLEIPAGQQVGMEYASNFRKPDAAVVVADNGGDSSDPMTVVWRQALPKGGHYKWRPVTP